MEINNEYFEEYMREDQSDNSTNYNRSKTPKFLHITRRHSWHIE